MIQKISLIFTLIAISGLALLHSCSKTNSDRPLGCDNKTEVYPLTPELKKRIPYKGNNDTIRLVSNSNDTILCISKVAQSFNTTDFVKYSNPACGPNGTEKLYGANKLTFIDSLKNAAIVLENYRFYPDDPYRTFQEVVISFKDKKFFIRSVVISDPKAPNYVGDIVVRGNTYLTVNKAELQTPDTACFLLLNKTNGIIKIQLNPNETWELLKN